jgi:hypothetical protein
VKEVNATMSEKTNNQASFGLLTICTTLELIGEHNGATAIARSALVDGKRTIRIGLCQEHLIVSRALQRADNLAIRFLIALSLVEFCSFWGTSRDGAAVRNELKRLAGYSPGDQAWGTAFASRLAVCEPMRVIDGFPLFGREPQCGPFTLLELDLPMRSPSDITNWRAKNGTVEVLKPIPPKPPRTSQEPAALVQAPDPFFEAFHRQARELLDSETFAALEDLSRGATDA